MDRTTTTTTTTRSARTGRNRAGHSARLRRFARRTLAAAAIGAGVLATAGTADAAVISSTGAAAETIGSCAYGNVVVDYGNIGFEYVRVSTYFYGVGWVPGQWNEALQGGHTIVAPSTNSGYAAVYVEYADWTAAGWEVGGEWVVFDGSTYWCLM